MCSFWPRQVTSGILVSRPGIEPGLPAVTEPGPNHWTARKSPGLGLSCCQRLCSTTTRAPRRCATRLTDPCVGLGSGGRRHCPGPRLLPRHPLPHPAARRPRGSMGWWTGQRGKADKRKGLGRGAPRARRFHHLFQQRVGPGACATPPCTLTHSDQRGNPHQHLCRHGVYLTIVISIPSARSALLNGPSGVEGRSSKHH